MEGARFVVACAAFGGACVLACGGGSSATEAEDAGTNDAGSDSAIDAPLGAGIDAGAIDASDTDADAGAPDARAACTGDARAGCYAITCDVGGPQSLSANRDRLLADLARRKCTDTCTLWSVLSKAERYIFLMDTAYFGDTASRVYPPGANDLETALDHAVALYSINAPDGSSLGGLDYNRIYLGFDALGACVMRNFAAANPTQDAGWNTWVKSDDLAGPHAPFTQREMIFWYRAIYDLQSEGPQFHHWHQDSDFTQSGIDQRLGVCGNTDPSLVEATIAFDFTHNSDPLGDYATRGGYGWEIVDQHLSINADWAYTPTACAATPPINTDQYGGGTFNGMGPVMGDAGACVTGWMGDAGCR